MLERHLLGGGRTRRIVQTAARDTQQVGLFFDRQLRPDPLDERETRLSIEGADQIFF